MNTDVQDFKSLVERIQTGERDYRNRLSAGGAELFKEVQSLFVKSIDEERRQIEAVASTGDVDRYNEIMLPEAFKESLPAYLKNPVVISTHQHRLETGHSSVVAQVIKAWIDAKGLHVIIWFAETELGNEFWYLYKNKFQRAFSVGYMEQEHKEEIIDGRRIKIHTKVELLEISCVPVPANQNALSKSKQRKQDFINGKIAQRKDEKRSNEFAEILLGEDLKAFGIPEAEDDGLELSGEQDLEPEPDYTEIVKTGSFLS